MTEVNEVNFSKGGKMAEGEGGGGLGKIIKLVIIALIGLVLIGGGIWAALFFLKSDSPEEGAATGQAPAEARSGPSFIENPQYLDLGSFVVNLSDGRKYIKTSLQLLLNDEKAKEFLNIRQAEVKDLVVAELQTLNSQQMKDPKERTLFRQRLLRKVESLLPTEDREWEDPKPIKKVLITEIYLQ